MGEEIKQQRAKAFKHEQDLAYRKELEAATLFSCAPDMLMRTFSVRRIAGVQPLVAKTLFVVPQPDGTIAAVDGTTAVGELFESDGAEFSASYQMDELAAGLYVAEVIEESGLTGDFVVRLQDHTKK